ncbi:hypothetical protein K439DRAFT_1661275 [Ramaria rubella]|nr:hypothetical protein K439DRAFT_1661275 [Ramaria rubella]
MGRSFARSRAIFTLVRSGGSGSSARFLRFFTMHLCLITIAYSPGQYCALIFTFQTVQLGAPRTWVHPCSCTLIAHQDCLLEWIKESQVQPSRRENALKCPQCNTRYIIDSRNPLLLRLMDRVDRFASQCGKYATLGIVAGVVVTFAGSVFGLCMFYGAHAVRVFVGDKMYSVIVGDNPNDWTWAVCWNLPLVPFYLIASHIRLIDATVFSTLTLPMMLAVTFPTPSTLAAAHETIVLPRFQLTYPPSPSLCVLMYPFLRWWYTSMRNRLMHWILRTPPLQNRQGVPARRQAWVLENNNGGDDDGNILGAGLRIDLDIEGLPQQAQPNPPNQEPGHPEGAQDQNGDGNAGRNVGQDADAGHRRVRVTFSSLGRFLCRALAMPWIAKGMGTVLELLSHRSSLLRQVLRLGDLSQPQTGWMRGIGTMRKLTDVGIGPFWYAEAMEPVWWRNTLGLSLWIIGRDAFTLMHLFLRKRELQSRRILSRSFAGIDAGTLDLISPAAF